MIGSGTEKMKNVVDDFQFLAWIRVVVLSLRNGKTEGGAVFGEKRGGSGELEMFMRHSCGSNGYTGILTDLESWSGLEKKF